MFINVILFLLKEHKLISQGP